jgi:hypothetical protein
MRLVSRNALQHYEARCLLSAFAKCFCVFDAQTRVRIVRAGLSELRCKALDSSKPSFEAVRAVRFKLLWTAFVIVSFDC